MSFQKFYEAQLNTALEKLFWVEARQSCSSSTEIGALLVASLNMKRGFGCVSISLRHVHCSLYYVACTISKGTQRSVALPAKYSTISQRTST